MTNKALCDKLPRSVAPPPGSDLEDPSREKTAVPTTLSVPCA